MNADALVLIEWILMLEERRKWILNISERENLHKGFQVGTKLVRT